MSDATPAPKRRERCTRPIGAWLNDCVKHYKEPPRGLMTGFNVLDKRFKQLLLPGSMTIVAGRPGTCKTMFGTTIAEYHANRGKNILIWSIEMTGESLCNRLISKYTGIPVCDLNDGPIECPEAWSKIMSAANIVHQMPFYVNDLGGVSDVEIRRETLAVDKELREKTGEGLALVVVDYIQLAKSATEDSREQEVAAVSGTLRELAKEMGIPILALAQLNRELEKRANKRPVVTDLRESGQLELDAGIILMLYRESMYCDDCMSGKPCNKGHEHELEVSVSKSRDGDKATVKLFFDGKRQLIGDLDKGDKGESSAPASGKKENVREPKSNVYVEAMKSRMAGGAK